MVGVVDKFLHPLLGPKLARLIGQFFDRVNDADKSGIVYCLVGVSSASARNTRLTFSIRLADFAAFNSSMTQERMAMLAACGFCNPQLQQQQQRRFISAVCFHCGQSVVVISDVGSDSDIAAAEADVCRRHRLASSDCLLALLVSCALTSATQSAAAAGATAEAAAAAWPELQARRFGGILRQLRPLLDAPAVFNAASFGFSVNFLRLCIARQACQQASNKETITAPQTPGGMLALAQDYQWESGGDALVALSDSLDICQLIDLCGPGQIQQQQQQQHHQSQRRVAEPMQDSLRDLQGSGGGGDGVANDSSAALTVSDPPAEADERCIQCRSRVRNRVALPCAHFVACDRCLAESVRCQKCQREILATVVAYIT